MTTGFVELDVRPTLRRGGDPFEEIMGAVHGLESGHGLRLLATFKPTPLLHVLASKGFTHEAKELADGEWEVLFRPSGGAASDHDSNVVATADNSAWPEPVQQLDNRDLEPPEPMVRILAATETLAAGEVLSALLCREPIFLFRELAKRGHAWRGAYEPDGQTYKVLVRIGTGKETTS